MEKLDDRPLGFRWPHILRKYFWDPDMGKLNGKYELTIHYLGIYRDLFAWSDLKVSWKIWRILNLIDNGVVSYEVKIQEYMLFLRLVKRKGPRA